MMHSNLRNPRKLKRTLLFLILLCLGGIVSIFIGQRYMGQDAGKVKKSIEAKATLSIDKIEQTATRDGVKQWTLTAKAARYFREQQKAVFDDLSVTFFLKKGEKAKLTAKEGLLNTTTNDMTATGNVVVTRSTGKINTETLHYNHEERIFHSDVPVSITGDSMVVTASSMNHNLNTGRTLLKGDVEGFFDELLDL